MLLTVSTVEGALTSLARAGMESVDAATRKALLEFSLHLCCGNMDEAYKVCCEAANQCLVASHICGGSLQALPSNTRWPELSVFLCSCAHTLVLLMP